jgi:hypothetical protein
VPAHLAQANVSYAKAPIADPIMRGFVDRLGEINSLAEASPGFVWRYISDSRIAAQREYEDPFILFNMSVWESIEALHVFTYRTAHAQVFAARKEWMEDWKALMGTSSFALWWIPEGTVPTVAEAKLRLASLANNGPTEYAFTFKQSYRPPR